jgi:hypothetical protein
MTKREKARGKHKAAVSNPPRANDNGKYRMSSANSAIHLTSAESAIHFKSQLSA